jgi:hypothetical protein
MDAWTHGMSDPDEAIHLGSRTTEGPDGSLRAITYARRRHRRDGWHRAEGLPCGPVATAGASQDRRSPGSPPQRLPRSVGITAFSPPITPGSARLPTPLSSEGHPVRWSEPGQRRPGKVGHDTRPQVRHGTTTPISGIASSWMRRCHSVSSRPGSSAACPRCGGSMGPVRRSGRLQSLQSLQQRGTWARRRPIASLVCRRALSSRPPGGLDCAWADWLPGVNSGSGHSPTVAPLGWCNPLAPSWSLG